MAFETQSSREFYRSSDKAFGLLMSFCFLCFAVFSFSNENYQVSVLSVLIAGILIFLSFKFPRLLQNPHNFWRKLGLLLGKISNPIVLGVVFLLAVTPIAIVLRMLGRDELRIKNDSLESFWVKKDILSSAINFKNQF